MSRAFIQKRLPFKPTDIGGCQLWLDAADTTSSSMTFSSGRNLSVWKDKSTSANNFNLISGTTTSVADGGQNAVYIPSGAVMRSVNQFTLTTSSAYFIVCKLITIGSGSVQNINDVLQFINIPVNGYIPYIRFYQGVLQGTATPGNPGNTNDIGNGNYFVNGTFNPNFDSSYYLNKYVIIDLVSPNVGGTTFLSISDTSFPRPFLGNIGEIICYPGGVTTPQRQQVESYLAQKWGLRQQLPQGHPGTRGIVYPSDPVNVLFRVPYTSAFTPSAVGTVSMWLDGTDPAGTGVKPSNGATVSTWVDKSGSGKNLTAVGTPTYVTASSSVYLNGGSYLQNTNFNFTNYTLFIVSVQASDQGPLYTNNTTTGGNSGFFPRYSNGNYYLVQSDGGWLSAGSPFANGTTYLYSIQYDSLNNINLWSNGSISPVITGTAGTITRNKFILGKRDASGFNENMTGNVFEVVQYNSDLGQTSRQQVEGYLAWKWGLQANLPVNHPYKNASPSITNQFGISRPAGIPIPPITISARSRSVIQVLISSGLLVRYRMNESSGSTLIDSVSGNNITVGGSPSRVSTSYGTYTGFALSIQNSTQNGYITLPANMVVGAHSITSWVYFTGLPTGRETVWVGWGSGCKGENHAFYNNNASISIIYGGPSCIYSLNFLDNNTALVSPQLNTWYFCVTTWDGSNTWKTYCYSPTTPYAFTFSYGMNAVTAGGVFAIGISNNLNAQFGGTGYGGYIGEVRFYNRVLTAAEVASIYAGTG